MRNFKSIVALAALAAAGPIQARVAPAWTASQQPVWDKSFIFPDNIPATLANRTYRQVVRIGIGGRDVRIVLSNTYGSRPVRIAGAHIAPSLGGSRIDASGDTLVRFGGAEAATVAPGATIVSDPLPIAAKAGQDLAVSLYFAEAPKIESFHWDGKRTGYVLDGNQLGAANPAAAATSTVRLLLSAILVDAPDPKGTVVVLGDSITDGAGATLDHETRWPDYLAARAAPRGIAVVNAGISGARLLTDGMGVKALARFDRDVLAQSDVKTLILLLGINDMSWPGSPFEPKGRTIPFEELTAGYRAIVERAHAANIRVIGATLPPFANALPGTPLAGTFYSPAKDAMRRRLNAWLRSENPFDQLVDFDRLLRDPASPDRLAPRYDGGDHLHPDDAGNKAMAEAIDLDTLIKE